MNTNSLDALGVAYGVGLIGAFGETIANSNLSQNEGRLIGITSKMFQLFGAGIMVSLLLGPKLIGGKPVLPDIEACSFLGLSLACSGIAYFAKKGTKIHLIANCGEHLVRIAARITTLTVSFILIASNHSVVIAPCLILSSLCYSIILLTDMFKTIKVAGLI